MRRPRRMRGRGVFVLVCAALLTSGGVGATLALYDASTQNAATTFSGGWIGAPSGASATAEGNDVTLKWTAGTQQVTGQKLVGEDKGTNESCTSAPKAELSTTLASASTSTYKDESRGTEANRGDWFCYELQSTSSSKWTAQAFKAVQLGLVSSAVSSANAASKCSKAPTQASGKIDCNDTIALTFNQKPILPASPIEVCVFSAGTIVLGDSETETKEVSKKIETTPVCKAATDPYSVGKLTVASATIGSSIKFATSRYTLSAAAPWTMTITLEGSIEQASVTGTPTWTFTPASTIKSSITTHQATICSAEKSTCRPTTTTDF
jgi:hypothetical protein